MHTRALRPLALLVSALMLALTGCSSDDSPFDSCTTNPALCARDGSRDASDAAAQRTDGAAADADTPYVHEDVSVQQVHTWLIEGKLGSAMTLVDVRTASEFAGGHIEGAINKPLGDLPALLDTIPRDEPVVVNCASGSRSNSGAKILAGAGFRPVYDMLGGTGAWTAASYSLVQ